MRSSVTSNATRSKTDPCSATRVEWRSTPADGRNDAYTGAPGTTALLGGDATLGFDCGSIRSQLRRKRPPGTSANHVTAPIDLCFDLSSSYGEIASQTSDQIPARFARNLDWHPIVDSKAFRCVDHLSRLEERLAEGGF